MRLSLTAILRPTSINRRQQHSITHLDLLVTIDVIHLHHRTAFSPSQSALNNSTQRSHSASTSLHFTRPHLVTSPRHAVFRTRIRPAAAAARCLLFLHSNHRHHYPHTRTRTATEVIDTDRGPVKVPVSVLRVGPSSSPAASAIAPLRTYASILVQASVIYQTPQTERSCFSAPSTVVPSVSRLCDSGEIRIPVRPGITSRRHCGQPNFARP